jgi:hypothetical protein
MTVLARVYQPRGADAAPTRTLPQFWDFLFGGKSTRAQKISKTLSG